MALTIDEMQIDVDKPAAASMSPEKTKPEQKPEQKEAKPDLNRLLKMRAERESRLRAD